MARRRQNGEGTIYQRPNGLWVCEITLGYNQDGKRIRKTVSSMDLDKLKKKINDLKYLNDRKLLKAPSDMILSDWIDFWLETYKKPQVKQTTYDMYYGAITWYIKPQIGHYKIDKLNKITVQKFINDLSTSGLQNGKLSTSSVKKVLITLSQAYSKAQSLNMIYENPCEGVQLPKGDIRKAVAFTPKEQEDFLAVCTKPGTYANLFIFAFNTGMRLGEIMALTWDDINLDDKTVSVNKTLAVVMEHDPNSEKKQKTIINSTKTSSGDRIIPLNKKAMNAIKNQIENNKNNSPFVFYSTAGTPVQKRNIYREFKNLLKQAGISSPVTFHSIRHSFATRLIEKGADIKTISELLGHKSIQITLDIYGHISSDLKGKTIALLD